MFSNIIDDLKWIFGVGIAFFAIVGFLYLVVIWGRDFLAFFV